MQIGDSYFVIIISPCFLLLFNFAIANISSARNHQKFLFYL